MTLRLIAILVSAIIYSAGSPGFSQSISAEQLRQQIDQAESDSQRVELKFDLLEVLESEDRQREIREEIGNILRLSTISGYQQGYINGLLKLGDYYLIRQIPDSALVPIREGLSQAKDPELRMQFLIQRGNVSRLEGNPIESIRYYNQARTLADSLDLVQYKARINYDLSRSQRMIGDYSSSFENLYRSLLQTEEANDSVLMAYVLNEIGELYHELDNAEEGIYYLQESEQMSRALNLTANLIKSIINLGISNLELGDFESASVYLTEAKNLVEKAGDLARLVMVDYNLGILNLRQNNLIAARDYFSEALEMSRERNLSEGIYHNSMGMGQYYKQSGNYWQALEWFEEAFDQAREMNSGPFVSLALEEIYTSYKLAGQTTLALETLESLHIHTDSVRTNERERSRAEYETLLESRRQEEENRLLLARQAEQEARIQLQQGLGIGTLVILAIVLGVTIFLYRNNRLREKLNRDLKERNNEISSKNEELDRLNNIKNKMFAVVAHDLRGPLSSLQSLLYLLREHDLSKKELDEIINSLEQSLHDNATTMENLLAWAKSQMSGIKINYRDFKLKAGAEAVYSQIRFQAEQKGISVQIDIQNDLEIYADYDMIKLVMRNIVSNAVKFCESGDKITISALQQDRYFSIRISDSGTGIKEEDQDKIFAEEHYSQKGTKNEQGSGLGLALCKEFIEKHGGEIWFESEYGEGTEFIFTIPVKGDSNYGSTFDDSVENHTSEEKISQY